ncbi:unnamed protein product [Cuscuta campestris]|uniref:Uncharacterized protein n=1 Tax=Cuscuta campestris TaxID=132261 RepID=A0A484N1X1_9ASTE|nr:unnamed protein product [Cuscuta campestris]
MTVNHQPQDERFVSSFVFPRGDSKRLFYSDFLNRPILSPKSVLHSVFCHLPFQDATIFIDRLGVTSFVRENFPMFCPNLIRLFYTNLTFNGRVLKTSVNGTDIEMTLKDIGELFKFSFESCDFHKFASKEFKTFSSYDTITEVCLEKVLGRERLTVGGLKPHFRILHYFISKVLAPRKSSHSKIFSSDTRLLFVFLNNIKIKWAKFFCNNLILMKSKGSLGYVFPIMNILRAFDVPLKDIHVQKNHTWYIDVATFNRSNVPRACKKKKVMKKKEKKRVKKNMTRRANRRMSKKPLKWNRLGIPLLLGCHALLHRVALIVPSFNGF